MELGKIPFKTALRLAKDMSGLTIEELGERTGIHTSQLFRYFSDDDYYPSPPRIVAISKAMNTSILAEWFLAQVDTRHNFNGYFKTSKELSDVITEITKALEDGRLSEYERRKLLKEVEEALRELNALKEHLMIGGKV